QPPQFLRTSVIWILKLSKSVVAATAALASLANLASLAVKSALFSQIAGNAAVSPPLLELSGKSAGAFSPASAKVANTFFAASRLKGCLASSMSVATLLWSPLAFISALRAAIGSLCATSAVAPNASIATTSAVRIISCSLCELSSAPGGAGWWASRKQLGRFFYSRWGENWEPSWWTGLAVAASLQRFASDFKSKNMTRVMSLPASADSDVAGASAAKALRSAAAGPQRSRFREQGNSAQITAYPPACPRQPPPTGAPPSLACPHGGCGKRARARPRRRSSPPGKTRWPPPPPPPSPPTDWCGTARCASRRRAAGYR